MSRNSNDDRSDSMNPNNGAYHASEANHNNQIGAYDDDDDDLEHSESGKQRRARYFEEQSAASNRGLVGICEATFSFSQRNQKEQTGKVASRASTGSSSDDDSEDTFGISFLGNDREISSEERALNSLCEALLNASKNIK